MEKKRFNYMLEIDILINCSQKELGVLRSAFYGFGYRKRHKTSSSMILNVTDYAHSRV